VCHLAAVIQGRGLVPSDAGRDMLCEYRDDSESKRMDLKPMRVMRRRDYSVLMCPFRLPRDQILVTRYIHPSQMTTGVASSTSGRSDRRPVGKVMFSGACWTVVRQEMSDCELKDLSAHIF